MADAQRHCRQKFTDLVTIGDLEEQNTVKGMWNTRTRAHIRFWIGLYMDNWKWSLSSTTFYQPGEMEYRGWAPGEPTNDDFKDLCTYMFQGDLVPYAQRVVRVMGAAALPLWTKVVVLVLVDPVD
ncbi:E-selectin [Liparis tanakae]|uniref:E-selectin n=1 Tax=Liparis tanakae TaxID=230148 RepID=A0A4Z2FZL5_9TELE|nr:E-selectin [Liparis tanakae]